MKIWKWLDQVTQLRERAALTQLQPCALTRVCLRFPCGACSGNQRSLWVEDAVLSKENLQCLGKDKGRGVVKTALRVHLMSVPGPGGLPREEICFLITCLLWSCQGFQDQNSPPCLGKYSIKLSFGRTEDSDCWSPSCLPNSSSS